VEGPLAAALGELPPADAAAFGDALDAAAAGEPRTVEHRQPTRAGDFRIVRSRLTPVRDATGQVVRIAGFSEDVTEQRELEARLRQAQRMEAVGQLAGGIAHDFNNLLTVITGNLELLAADLPPDLPPDHPAREDADEIARATGRARQLVRQLLAFSRKQPARPQHLRVGELVRSAEKLLRRVIGEEIALEVHVGDDEAAVHVDAGQLEQVLLNLAVNARDAMLTPLHGHPGTGGVLAIEVDALALDAAEARRWDGVAPGAWVRLRVRDTGHGMDAATRAQAFEPFFTTKDVGRGTGLGLATVFGIVRQAAARCASTARRAAAPPSPSWCPPTTPPPRRRRRPRRRRPRRGARRCCSSRTRRRCAPSRGGCSSGAGTRCSRPATAPTRSRVARARRRGRGGRHRPPHARAGRPGTGGAPPRRAPRRARRVRVGLRRRGAGARARAARGVRREAVHERGAPRRPRRRAPGRAAGRLTAAPRRGPKRTFHHRATKFQQISAPPGWRKARCIATGCSQLRLMAPARVSRDQRTTDRELRVAVTVPSAHPGDEKLVQLIERLDHCIGCSGAGGVERFLRRIALVQDHQRLAALVPRRSPW
jgi:signal transduction histidine kinase